MNTRIDFTNILRAGLMHADFKRAKKTDSLTVFFALLRFARIKTGEIDPKSVSLTASFDL